MKKYLRLLTLYYSKSVEIVNSQESKELDIFIKKC